MAETCVGSRKAGSDVKIGLLCEQKMRRLHFLSLLSLWYLQSRGLGGAQVDSACWGGGVCMCDGQSDRRQAGRGRKVDGPRRADGWVAKADGSRSLGRQDDGQ